jgi:hypothetical protein
VQGDEDRRENPSEVRPFPPTLSPTMKSSFQKREDDP